MAGLGQPVRIADLARLLAASTKRSVPLQFTGLRPGEKLHESLLGTGELDYRPAHPLIAHVDVPPLDPAKAWALELGAGGRQVVERLASLSTVAAGMASQDR